MKIRMREIRQYVINNDSYPFRWDVLLHRGIPFVGSDESVCSGMQFTTGSNSVRYPGTPIDPSDELKDARIKAAKQFKEVMDENGWRPESCRDLITPECLEWSSMIEVEIDG